MQGNHNLSTHEKELLDLQAKIELMEKSNLEPKTWTMQGEVMFCLLFVNFGKLALCIGFMQYLHLNYIMVMMTGDCCEEA